MVSWSGKTEFKDLSAELAQASDKIFERLVTPLLQAIWPALSHTSPRGQFDHTGIDAAVATDGVVRVAVQCKGFEVLDEELARSQVDQCLKSVNSLSKSGLHVEHYILVHNRNDPRRVIESSLQPVLDSMVASGQVGHAEVWSRATMLRCVFDALYEHVKNVLPKVNQARFSEYLSSEPLLCTPLEVVPLSIKGLMMDQHRLLETSIWSKGTGDPALELMSGLATGGARLCIVVGEAGFGKTSAVLRSVRAQPRGMLFLPAAAIASQTMSTKDLLQQCVDVDAILDAFREDGRILLKRILRPVLDRLLKDSDYPVCLVIDGLDESQWVSRRGGLQWLFNCLHDITVPIVLTARIEYWRVRQADFEAAYGQIAVDQSKRRQQAKLVELLPWNDEEILVLTKRFRDELKSEEERDRLEQLVALIESGEYRQYYGDIPRRPLFLRFILETVAQTGPHEAAMAGLVNEWVRMKIKRDLVNSTIYSASRRMGIVNDDEPLEMTIELAFRAMERAALLMTVIEDGELGLLPSCSLDALLQTDQRLERIVDPTGLVLNTLLCPSLPRDPVQGRTLSFTHRTYQEFFLARAVTREPHVIHAAQIPDEVEAWCDRIRREKLFEM